jgi:tetraacyldisaccharide 4'-kinase
MKLHKPKFWDNKKTQLLSYILLPLTIPIIINNLFLKFRTKKKTNKIKSICIGNIYVGGTGKTPITIKLYELFNRPTFKVSTAKKFYKNQIDEQIILKNKTNLIVSSSRQKALEHAINDNNDLIIFDDGLQEKAIDYNLKIVCFNSKNWIGNGQLFPAGPLREKIVSLKKYDAVFLNGNSTNNDEIKRTIHEINPKIIIFETKYVPINLKKIDFSNKFLAFSGIGNSHSFKETLTDNNIKIIKEINYPDHYDYKKKDIANIKREAKIINAKIITTEKDYVKLSVEDKAEISFLEIGVKIDNEDKLINFIKKHI